ncbi:uncharacterized protein METZ01_LOCUS114243, partial [marine metagenome]
GARSVNCIRNRHRWSAQLMRGTKYL